MSPMPAFGIVPSLPPLLPIMSIIMSVLAPLLSAHVSTDARYEASSIFLLIESLHSFDLLDYLGHHEGLGLAEPSGAGYQSPCRPSLRADALRVVSRYPRSPPERPLVLVQEYGVRALNYDGLLRLVADHDALSSCRASSGCPCMGHFMSLHSILHLFRFLFL